MELKRLGFRVVVTKEIAVETAELWYKLKTETPYVYITKIGNNGEISRRSLGLPAADVPELVKLLQKACESKPRIKQ